MKKAIILLALICITFYGCGTEKQANQSGAENSNDLSISSATESSALLSSEGISGSNYIDIKLSLEERGFEKSSPKAAEGSEDKVWYGNYTDPETEVNLYCGMVITPENEIRSGTFEASNKKPINEDDFIAYAEQYLKFCSTMPYDKSDTKKISDWVSKNISSRADKPTIQIGDAEFQLSGTEFLVDLSVSKVI